jgi:hypothetical protein
VGCSSCYAVFWQSVCYLFPSPSLTALYAVRDVRIAMFGTKKDALRRGEYRNYTFRLPTHVPALTFAINAESGCVCLYASNCSERPLPRLCQWTLLVDAQKQKYGTLTVRTSEVHFVSGLYHVGLYCVADAAFSLSCSTSPQPYISSPAPSPRREPTAAAEGSSGAAAAAGVLARPLPRVTKKPFIDAGLLEDTLSARARAPGSHALPPMPPANGRGGSSASPAPNMSSPRAWVPPGDRHYANVLGEWHRTLRDALDARSSDRDASPRRRDGARGGVGVAHVADATSSHFSPRQSPRAPRQANLKPSNVAAKLGAPMHLTPRWLGGTYA